MVRGTISSCVSLSAVPHMHASLVSMIEYCRPAIPSPIGYLCAHQYKPTRVATFRPIIVQRLSGEGTQRLPLTTSSAATARAYRGRLTLRSLEAFSHQHQTLRHHGYNCDRRRPHHRQDRHRQGASELGRDADRTIPATTGQRLVQG